jgi:hypothetical protein
MMVSPALARTLATSMSRMDMAMGAIAMDMIIMPMMVTMATK